LIRYACSNGGKEDDRRFALGTAGAHRFGYPMIRMEG
jgi:hypothetical protein